MTNTIVGWTGKKKGELLNTIVNIMPPYINNYYEPFCGSAQVFLKLEALNVINGNYYISDLNSRLIRIYKEVTNNLQSVDQTLQNFVNICTNNSIYDVYYTLRNIEDTPWKKPYNNLGIKLNSVAELVAKDIFLSHMCKNGWREGPNGFNVPYYNSRTNPNYFYRPNDLTYFSKVLNKPNVNIKYCSYLKILKDIKPDDFIYIDPPYRKVDNKTGKYQIAYNYTAEKFTEKEQYRLAKVLDYINKRGAKFILSNDKCAAPLYSKYTVIGANAKGYNSIPRNEILVYNY